MCYSLHQELDVASMHKREFQQVSIHNSLLRRCQLRHIPKAIDIPPTQPLPPLLRQVDKRIRAELRRLSEYGLQLIFHPVTSPNNVRQDVARMDAERRETLLSVLCGNEVRQADNGGFGCLVGAQCRGGDECADAADVDEDFALAFEEERDAGAGHEIWASEIDGHCFWVSR